MNGIEVLVTTVCIFTNMFVILSDMKMMMASTAALVSIASFLFYFLWVKFMILTPTCRCTMHDAETSDEAKPLSKAATGHTTGENDVVNLRNLQDQDQGQSQDVALVVSSRNEGQAAASTAASPEGATMERMRTHGARRAQKRALVSIKKVNEKLVSKLRTEAAKELASSSESGLLSKAATQADMEHIRTKSVRVNLRKLQPKVEGQGQEVALVSSMRDEGLAAAFTAPSTEGAITRTPGRRHPHGATQMKKATSTRTRGGPATH